MTPSAIDSSSATVSGGDAAAHQERHVAATAPRTRLTSASGVARARRAAGDDQAVGQAAVHEVARVWSSRSSGASGMACLPPTSA